MKDDNGTNEFATIVGMDGRAASLLGFAKSEFIGGSNITSAEEGSIRLIPFIIKLDDADGIEIFFRLFEDGYLYVPILYQDALRDRVNRHYIAYATDEFFVNVAASDKSTEPPLLNEFREASKEILLCTPTFSHPPNWLAGDSRKEPSSPEITPTNWPNDSVVIGIIDDGIAFAGEHFTNATGTRVQFFWRQGGPHKSPATVDYGTELTKNEIDILRGSNTNSGILDEDSFYREAGIVDYSEPNAFHRAETWRASHGTHVADLAAGAPKLAGIDNRPIICVQLPSEAVQDLTLSSWEDKIKHGIDYIIQRASLLTKVGDDPLPVVINFSFGKLAGPHDGTGTVEQNIDETLAVNSHVRIVLPSGNSHLSRCHAQVTFQNSYDIVDLHWRVQPDDQTLSWLHIWMPHDSDTLQVNDRMKIRIFQPGNTLTPIPVPNSSLGDTDITKIIGYQDSNGNVVCSANVRFVAGKTKRVHFCIALAPTSKVRGSLSTGPSGLWVVRLQNLTLIPEQRVEAWIERDGQMHGYPRTGRQSYFDEPCYERFDHQGRVEDEDLVDCHIMRAGLINAIATGQLPIVVGGLISKEMQVAEYSAGGPATPASDSGVAFRIGPDVASSCDDSKVHRGILGAGSRSGSTVAFNGTSMAAPLVARKVADDLGSGGQGDAAFVRSLAIPGGDPNRTGGRIMTLPHPYMKITRI